MLKLEPVLIVNAIIAALNVVQLSALHMSTLAHVIIVAVTTFLGAIVARQAVTPVSRP